MQNAVYFIDTKWNILFRKQACIEWKQDEKYLKQLNFHAKNNQGLCDFFLFFKVTATAVVAAKARRLFSNESLFPPSNDEKIPPAKEAEAKTSRKAKN